LFNDHRLHIVLKASGFYLYSVVYFVAFCPLSGCCVVQLHVINSLYKRLIKVN